MFSVFTSVICSRVLGKEVVFEHEKKEVRPDEFDAKKLLFEAF